MKKFSDLKIGDKIYIFISQNYIKSHTISGISTLSSGELIFKTFENHTISVRKEDIDKSISILEDFSTYIYIDLIITDLEIAKWFDL